MDLLIGIIVGFVLGGGVIKALLTKKPVGSLHAYKPDEDDQTFLYLELFEDIENLCQEKQVVFKMEKSFLTQK